MVSSVQQPSILGHGRRRKQAHDAAHLARLRPLLLTPGRRPVHSRNSSPCRERSEFQGLTDSCSESKIQCIVVGTDSARIN
jgi:hypothetical protein